MSTIDLYQVLKQIPNVSDEQAKNAADSVTQSDRLTAIETNLAGLRGEFRVATRVGIALQIAILAFLLAHIGGMVG